MRSILQLICLSTLFIPLAFAQTVRPVDCRFLWFDHANNPPVLLNVGPDGADIRCEIPATTLSSPVRCFAQEDTIRFLHESDRSLAAIGKIPLDVKSAILVFLPAPKSEAAAAAGNVKWRVYVIDDSPQNFPHGGAFVANFYGDDIRFVIGEHRNQLRAGGTHAVIQPTKRDDFNMAPVIVQFQQGDSWRTASESTVRFIPDLRYLILAYVDQASGRPRIATFTDARSAVPVPVD